MRRLLLFTFLLGLVSHAVLASAQGIVWRSYKAGVTAVSQSSTEEVIQNQAAFETFWKTIAASERAPRDVDFSKEFLIAVRLGQRPSGGYRVLIRSVEKTKPNEITVTYEERRPAPGAPVTLMMTSPYEVVRVERKNATGSFVFKKREVTDSGGGYVEPGNSTWRTYTCDIGGGGDNEFTRAIRNEREWEAYWKVFSRGPAPSDINWDNEMAVAIHLGNRPSNGYDVLVEAIDQVRGGFVVHYIEKAPSAGQRVRQGTTSPFTIIRLPRLSGDIHFQKRVWRSDG